jgi:hypothetical protein
MSFAGLLIAISSAVLLAVLIFAPVLRGGATSSPSAESETIQRQRETLRLAYNAVLQTLRDLEDDHASGRLSDADYASEKARWNAEGVRLLRERDEARHAAAKLQKSQGK